MFGAFACFLFDNTLPNRVNLFPFVKNRIIDSPSGLPFEAGKLRQVLCLNLLFLKKNRYFCEKSIV